MLPRISVLTHLCVILSALLPSSWSLAVQGSTALVLVAAEREGGFALRLSHFAGQMDEGLNERSSVGHRDLPQPDLLLPRPLLSHLAVHSPLILQVQLITHNNNSHLWDGETKFVYICFSLYPLIMLVKGGKSHLLSQKIYENLISRYLSPLKYRSNV